MKYEIKFEWIFASFLMAALSVLSYCGSPEVKTAASMALISGFSASIGYIFGKTAPDQPKVSQ